MQNHRGISKRIKFDDVLIILCIFFVVVETAGGGSIADNVRSILLILNMESILGKILP